MLTQAADSLARWPVTAIHDSVAGIVQHDEYQRRLARSLAERFMAWFFDRLSALFDVIAATPGARSVTLIVTALLVAALALRILLAARYERRMPRTTPALSERGLRSLPTLDEARRLAREGRYADAMHVLYAAILDALSQRRLVRLHSSKTSGDFARELRGGGHPAYDAFRTFVRRFDRLFYGYDVCDAETFDALFGEAERVIRAASPAVTR
ncbi:MAG: DUF4129 domain-containing protein [Gemmatimonadaceae bacterium]